MRRPTRSAKKKQGINGVAPKSRVRHPRQGKARNSSPADRVATCPCRKQVLKGSNNLVVSSKSRNKDHRGSSSQRVVSREASNSVRGNNSKSLHNPAPRANGLLHSKEDKSKGSNHKVKEEGNPKDHPSSVSRMVVTTTILTRAHNPPK